MKLPFEVLSTSMKIHQKYFSVLSKNKKIAPYFLVVSNTPPNNIRDKTVIKGNERVLRARLSDALFFWETDILANFEEWLESLKDVVYYDKLGSLFDRSKRISETNLNISKFFAYQDFEKVKTIGLYSKVDLVSKMVQEFPELQGVMGGIMLKKKAMMRNLK